MRKIKNKILNWDYIKEKIFIGSFGKKIIHFKRKLKIFKVRLLSIVLRNVL